MRIWLACFGVLFAIAELYQWLKHLTLPLPIYILGGAFLAIASNYNKRAGLPWQELDADSEPLIGSGNNPPSWGNVTSKELPQPISFKIRQVQQREEKQ